MAKDTAENEARIARKKKKDDKNKVQKVKVNSDAIRDDDDDDDDDDNDEGEGEDDDNNADKSESPRGRQEAKQSLPQQCRHLAIGLLHHYLHQLRSSPTTQTEVRFHHLFRG
jgi:hypothetical protein